MTQGDVDEGAVGNDAAKLSLKPEDQIALWSKYEEIAMHFNDLCLKLRTQALAGLTAIIALSGIAANMAATATTMESWDVVFGTVIFLIFAWVAIGMLDMFYYHTLLLGAVDALLEIENDSPINISTRIEERFASLGQLTLEQKRSWLFWFKQRRVQLAFYGIGLVALILAAFATKLMPEAASSDKDTLKVNIDRNTGENLELKITNSKGP